MINIINKLYMDNDLFYNNNKNFTVRLNKRSYDKNSVIINILNNEEKEILIYDQIVCKVNELEKYNIFNYFNILKKYYKNISENDIVTIIYYKGKE